MSSTANRRDHNAHGVRGRSTFNIIPDDVLQMILLLAAGESHQHGIELTHGSRPCGADMIENATQISYPQLPLGAVNRRIRSIVLSTAQFWTTISSTLDKGAIDVFLQRSGNATLDVRMTSSDEFFGEEFRQFVQKMLTNANRWATLVFVIDGFKHGLNAIDFILSKTKNLVLPTLTSLEVLYSHEVFNEVRHAPEMPDESYPFSGHCQWIMPKLTHAVGYNNVPQIHNCDATMNSLVIAVCEAEDFEFPLNLIDSILSKMKNLKELSLRFEVAFSNPTDSAAPPSLIGLPKTVAKRVNMPLLVSLTIDIIYCQGEDGLMHTIREAVGGLPSLQSLVANFSFDKGNDYAFDNQDIKVAFQEFLQILDNCPQLLSLDISTNWSTGYSPMMTYAWESDEDDADGGVDSDEDEKDCSEESDEDEADGGIKNDHAQTGKSRTSFMGKDYVKVLVGTGTNDDPGEEVDDEMDGENEDEGEPNDIDSEASRDASPYLFPIQTLWERCERLQHLRICGNGFDFKNKFELPDKVIPLHTFHIADVVELDLKALKKIIRRLRQSPFWKDFSELVIEGRSHLVRSEVTALLPPDKIIRRTRGRPSHL